MVVLGLACELWQTEFIRKSIHRNRLEGLQPSGFSLIGYSKVNDQPVPK